MTTALIPQPPPEARLGTASVPNLDFSLITPEIMARAAAIAADVVAKDGTISPAQALAAAYHFAATGEVIGRHSYVGTRGNVAGRVIEGYRGVARELNMARYQWRYRPLTAEERELHDVREGDKALACEVDVLEARQQCILMGIPYQPIIGYTVVRRGDPLNIPRNRTAYWVLCKQARIDALRQVGENVEADEVLEDARANGIQIEMPDKARLTREQAEATVRAAITPREPAPPNTVELMRGPEGFEGFGDEAQEHTTAAESAALLSANATVQPAPSPTPTVNGPRASSPTPASAQTNGRPRLAVIRTKRLFEMAATFAADHDYYRTKAGAPDIGHMQASATKLGYAEITDANLSEIMHLLSEHARAHKQEK